jgi:hypothetical protein
MEIETVIRESQAEELVTPLGFQTETGKQQFSKQLRFFTAKEDALKRRQEAIESLRRTLTPQTKQLLETCFQEVKDVEPQIKIFFQKSDVEKNSYEQLTFSAWASTQVLNTVPFVLLLLSYFKLYIVPFLAILSPLFLLVMPYIILVYMYHLPISFNQYKDLMLGMIGVQAQSGWTPRNLMQLGLTGFSVIQSMVQPVQNALHLQTVDKDLVQKGKAIETLAVNLQRISTLISLKNPLEDIAERAMLSSDVHRSFADAWDLPFRLQYALRLLGDAEVTYRIAVSPTKEVLFSKKEGISFTGAYDPLVQGSIPFTVSFNSSKHHTLLTGPNKGGKSSFLRGFLLNLILAQTFGYAFCDSSILKPVNWIATGLRIEDRPGKSSLFEREVEFAVEILKRAKQNPQESGVVLFDELFHSTNPPDGTRTAKTFLDQLWNQSNIYSIISTHVFSLVKEAPENINRLCVPASLNEEGHLQFTYTLQQGICEVSSVDMILEQKGLLNRGKLDSGKPQPQGENERLE